MQYFIVTEKNGDRSLVCAPNEQALTVLIASQDDDFEFESYLRLDSDTFDRAGFIMYEKEEAMRSEDKSYGVYELFEERTRVADQLRKVHVDYDVLTKRIPDEGSKITISVTEVGLNDGCDVHTLFAETERMCPIKLLYG